MLLENPIVLKAKEFREALDPIFISSVVNRIPLYLIYSLEKFNGEFRVSF